jgi:hypothetical protein
VIAGSGHSIVITTNGDVYSFGVNCSGQLGSVIQKTVSNHVLLGNMLIFAEILLVTDIINCHLLVRSLQGIRITQAAVGSR